MWPLPVMHSDPKFHVYFLFFSHACCMPYLSHTPDLITLTAVDEE
jgi:hypothetical protein